VLGRQSTPEELAALEDPANSFWRALDWLLHQAQVLPTRGNQLDFRSSTGQSSTRGFSVARRARFGARKAKKRN